MKIIALGDTHGRNDWKEISKNNMLDVDKFIFIGDYFDSFYIPFAEQMKNFKEILGFKKKFPDIVVLLIGNHDYHYISPNTQYSGYQDEHAQEIGDALNDAIEAGQMQMCTLDDGFLFSHAGVTKTWAETAHIDLKNIEGSINKCFMFTQQMFKFMDYEGADNSGDNVYQSPIWVRPKSLLEDGIEGFVQVVGHTQHKEITSLENRVIFIDTLYQSGEYLEIKDGVVEGITIKT